MFKIRSRVSFLISYALLKALETVEIDETLRSKVVFGKLGRVEFKLNERKGILIPESYLSFAEKKPFVKLLKEYMENCYLMLMF